MNINNYFDAISTSSILLDICSIIEYPNINKIEIRYKKWIEDYLITLIYGESSNVKKYLNYPNIYTLICTLLHLVSANASLQFNYQNNVEEISQFD